MKKRLNGNQLKLIAVVSMLIDHIGLVIVGNGILSLLSPEMAGYHRWYLVYLAMRSVGRIAFPIYAYLLVEGCVHTKNWRNYALRLGLFAVLSEIPFDWMTGMQASALWQTQNVFFTLFLGLLMMKALEAVGQRRRVGDRRWESLNLEALWQLGVIAIACCLACLIKSDYDYIGIMLIAIFYWFRGEAGRQCLVGFVWLAWMFCAWYYILGQAAAFVLLYCYNGRRGHGDWKYGYYLFYPAHMAALAIISQIIFGRN